WASAPKPRRHVSALRTSIAGGGPIIPCCSVRTLSSPRAMMLIINKWSRTDEPRDSADDFTLIYNAVGILESQQERWSSCAFFATMLHRVLALDEDSMGQFDDFQDVPNVDRLGTLDGYASTMQTSEPVPADVAPPWPIQDTSTALPPNPSPPPQQISFPPVFVGDEEITPQSIRSWWSDSNPVGATVSIHAAAKPLMKIMYHSQARGLIKRYRDVPLSKEVLDIYLAYLMFKYVSPATKTMVLSELRTRAISEEEAPTVVEWLSSDPWIVMELLDSFDVEIRRWGCTILAGVSGYEAETGAIVTIEPCRRLIALLSDTAVWEEAICTLAKTRGKAEGAQTVVEADALLHAPYLLKSTNAQVRRWSCQLLGNLARHDSTATAVLQIAPCPQLVSLSKQDNQIHSCAMYALSMISNRPDGALAVVNANVRELITELLTSSNLQTLGWTSVMLECLAEHQPAAFAVLSQMGTEPHWHVISLLSGGNVEFRGHGLHALTRILKAGGAQEIVEAGVLDYVGELLDTNDKQIPEQTCAMLSDLVSYLPTIRLPLWDAAICQPLIRLSRHNDLYVRQNAIFVLSAICAQSSATQTALHMDVFDHVLKLLQSPDPLDVQFISMLVGDLVRLAARATREVPKGIPYQQVIFSSDDVTLFTSAASALHQISLSRDGAEAVLNAGALDYASELLESVDVYTRAWTCAMLGNLARHELLPLGGLVLEFPRRLVSLLSDGDKDVRRYSTYALYYLSRGAGGERAVLDAQVLDYVLRLLHDPDTLKWALLLVGQLVNHAESTAMEILGLNPCQQLVLLSNSNDLPVYQGAVRALYMISQWCDGAKAVLNAGALDYVPKLLESADADTKGWTCSMLGIFARQKLLPFVGLCLASRHLVPLLSDRDVDPEGERAVLEEKVLDLVPQLLDSSDHDTQKWTLLLVGQLAGEESTAMEILRLDPWQQLLRLSKFDAISSSAVFAMRELSLWADGARAGSNAGAVDHVWRLLRSPDTDTKDWTCLMVGNFARHLVCS
ncbi:armadillo-type protein, partial [Mycena polygramma]